MTTMRIPSVVRIACKNFVLEKKLPFGQYRILLDLATKSYKALSLEEREKWTLEQVITQGL